MDGTPHTYADRRAAHSSPSEVEGEVVALPLPAIRFVVLLCLASERASERGTKEKVPAIAPAASRRLRSSERAKGNELGRTEAADGGYM